jgi:hypothetical protein
MQANSPFRIAMNKSLLRTLRCRANRASSIWGAFLLLGCAGCSSDLADSIVTASRSAEIPQQLQGLGPQSNRDPSWPEESGQANRGELIATTASDLPSPDRTNPFEVSGDVETDLRDDGVARKREIRIVGFVELDDPTVMLSVDGKTQVFRSGETIDRITVTDIAPPNARINYDGVNWNASLYDRRSK